MAVFGLLLVHEDDALRAVRAAVDTREDLAYPEGSAVSATDLPGRPSSRLARWVAGDATRGQRLGTGYAVNVAARLEHTLHLGEVLITAEMYRLVRDAVYVEPAGPGHSSRPSGADPDPAPATVDQPAAGHDDGLADGRRDRPRWLLDEAFAEAHDEWVCHLFTILGAVASGSPDWSTSSWPRWLLAESCSRSLSSYGESHPDRSRRWGRAATGLVGRDLMADVARVSAWTRRPMIVTGPPSREPNHRRTGGRSGSGPGSVGIVFFEAATSSRLSLS